MADFYAARSGIIPPLQWPTFAPPFSPDIRKGVDIALAVAELCSEIPFSFVRAWTLPRDAEERLQAQIANLPNVSLRHGTREMRTIYCDARIVLVPSRWEEAFGRVVAEAHICGIPVVASDLGGLPEAVGSGGILISPDAPASDWAAAVRTLWNDRSVYARYREAALRHAAREHLNPDHQISTLLSIFAKAHRQSQPGAT